jgi:hypothetical protein
MPIQVQKASRTLNWNWAKQNFPHGILSLKRQVQRLKKDYWKVEERKNK